MAVGWDRVWRKSGWPVTLGLKITGSGVGVAVPVGKAGPVGEAVTLALADGPAGDVAVEDGGGAAVRVG